MADFVKVLKSKLDYDPTTGIFTRRYVARGQHKRPIGSIAGYIAPNGYRRLRVGVKCYYAHRLAWLYVNGHWPETELDHVSGEKDDNRIANLRLATRSLNMANYGKPKNNSSGERGVHFDKTNKKWMAFIMVNKRFKNLGRFVSKDEAIAARQKAAHEYFGEYAREQPMS